MTLEKKLYFILIKWASKPIRNGPGQIQNFLTCL